jgi:hypothetical protein
MSPRMLMLLIVLVANAMFASRTPADEPPPLTTLSRPDVVFQVPERPYHVVRRGAVTMVVVNNEAVDDDVLPGHRAGYSGIARLSYEKRADNLFVPAYAGLNFEHIFDGTTQEGAVLFEPRMAPMELRVIDPFTVELYQAPTPFWGLESCHQYRLLEDGTIELTFECVPRQDRFRNNYIGLFWASYIQRPESLDIHFVGHPEGQPEESGWVRGVTPAHGIRATHRAADDQRDLAHDPDFPLTLVFGMSDLRYTQPWYFGVRHGMAFAQIFHPQDRVRLTQSPSGGGEGNPAWDFQYLITDYQLDRRYQLVMRACYLPFVSADQVAADTLTHRQTLGHEAGQ